MDTTLAQKNLAVAQAQATLVAAQSDLQNYRAAQQVAQAQAQLVQAQQSPAA